MIRLSNLSITLNCITSICLFVLSIISLLKYFGEWGLFLLSSVSLIISVMTKLYMIHTLSVADGLNVPFMIPERTLRFFICVFINVSFGIVLLLIFSGII